MYSPVVCIILVSTISSLASAGILKATLGLEKFASDCCPPCHEKEPCHKEIVQPCQEKVTPCHKEVVKPCKVCPELDYDHAKTKGTGKALEVLLKGKNLATGLAAKVAYPLTLPYDFMSQAAAALPGIMAAKGALVGNVLAVPMKFTASASSAIVKGLSHVLVGVPVGVGTGVAAGAAGLIESYNDIQEQKERREQCLHPNKCGHKEVAVIGTASGDVIINGIQGDEGVMNDGMEEPPKSASETGDIGAEENLEGNSSDLASHLEGKEDNSSTTVTPKSDVENDIC